MPDPNVLYAVSAVVLLGLVCWVVAVRVRAPAATPALALGKGGAVSLPSATGTRQGELARAGVERPLDDKDSQPPADDGRASFHMKASLAQLEVDVIEEEDDPTGPYAMILVTAVGCTDPGLKRKHNEDAYMMLEDHHCFVIADGMGRHAAGEVASQLAVDAIASAFKTGFFGDGERDRALPERGNNLRSAIMLANDRVLTEARANEEYHGMGTTVVAAYFSPNKQRVYIAHVGDSRAYRIRDGHLSQLTKDHTLGAAGIQGKSAALLSRAVGIEENVDVEMTMESPLPGDIYLLCSDGLSRMASDEEIFETVTSVHDLSEATRKLIEVANSRGGRDNITAILVRVDKPPIGSGGFLVAKS